MKATLVSMRERGVVGTIQYFKQPDEEDLEEIPGSQSSSG